MTELFLIAHIGDRGVAILAEQVHSAVDIGPVVAVPRAGVGVRGLAALRSRVVTVIDTRVVLGLPATERPGRAVIAAIGGHDYAFLVDALEDVAPFARTAATAGTAGRGWAAAAAGVVEREGEPLLVLDLAALVPDPFAADFASLAA